jgi:hypothetical protein
MPIDARRYHGRGAHYRRQTPEKEEERMIPINSAMMVAATMQHTRNVLAQQAEEEKNFMHDGGDGKEYEYKILRTFAYSTHFSEPVRFQNVLAEEAVAGWELHEKLDDFRIRLRRLTSYRAKDALLTQDPYRTLLQDPSARRRLKVKMAMSVLMSFVILLVFCAIMWAMIWAMIPKTSL